MNKAAAAAVADPAVRQRFADIELQAEGGPAPRLAALIANELALHRRIAADAKLQFD